MKRNKKLWIRWALGICLIPIALVLLLAALLYIPAVQDAVVTKTAQYFSEATGMDVHVGRIRLSFPFNLRARDVFVLNAEHDTLIRFGELDAGISPLPLLRREIVPTGGVHLGDAQFDAGQWVDGMTIYGAIDHLHLNIRRIQLLEETFLMDNLLLSDADVTICIDSLTQAADSASAPLNWQLFLNTIHLKRIKVHFMMPSDSVSMEAFIDDALVAGSQLDLAAQRYVVRQFTVADAKFGYDRGVGAPVAGLDMSHIALSDIGLSLDSLLFCGREMNAVVRSCTMKERSGLDITMSGRLQSDSTLLSAPLWSVQTPYSKLSFQASVPWRSLDKQPQDNLHISLNAMVDRRDVIALVGSAVASFEKFWPDTAFNCAAVVDGNMNRLNIKNMYGELLGVFKVEASGLIEKMSDPHARAGNITLTADTYDGTTLQSLTGSLSGGRFRMPPNVRLEMNAALQQGEYQLEMLLAEQQGKVNLDGRYHPVRQTYSVTMKIDSLAPIHFLPLDSVTWLKASLHAEGKGSNLFAASTWAQIEGEIPEIHYKDMAFDGFSFDGSLKDNCAQAVLRSACSYMQGDVTLDGTIREKDVSGQLTVHIDTLNLHDLKMAEQPLALSFRVVSEFASDLDKRHNIDMTIDDSKMSMGRQKFNAKAMTLHADSQADSSHAVFHAGDLSIALDGSSDWATLANGLGALSNEAVRQLRTDTALNLSQLRLLFPDMRLTASARRDNPVYNYLQERNMFFTAFDLSASISPENGLQADASLHDFISDTMKIDTVRLNMSQDLFAVKYAVDVIKNKFRNQQPFRAGAEGSLQDNMASAELLYRNGQGETGLHVGIRARKMQSGVSLQLFPERPVLAFLTFGVNKDNYVDIRSLSDISADLQLEGDNDASLWLRSQEENGVMQELSFEINHINLSKIFGKADGVPLMQGLAALSLRYVPAEGSYMLVTDANVDDLFYRGGRIGEVLFNGVYLPLGGGQHQIDLHLFHDRNEISTLSTLYVQSRRSNSLDGVWAFNDAPLRIFNPLMGNVMHLEGSLHGELKIAGDEKMPVLNGFVQLDTTTAYIAAAGTNIRFDEQKVDIKDSKVFFNKYKLFTSGDNPFVINGTIDFGKAAKGEADLQLTAADMQLLNAPKNNESIVYGKMFVNLNSTIKGPLNALKMRGNLHLQGNTNMSYIMKESPLATTDRIADLVTFSYFRDTIPQRARRMTNRMPREFAAIGGLDMLLTLKVDPAVKLKVDLDEIGNNRIEMKGGGDLSLQYTPQGETRLTGRYTFSDGLIKYNMPVIADKVLKIKEDSYVEWTGEPFDPVLHLTATERVRSSVSTDGQTSHTVNFEAGIALKQRMSELDLQFTLEALDDATVQNQLVAMGTEERSKQAVSMLLTGMYLAADGTGRAKLDMNAALNTFLQGEINHITGSLLKNGDLNFGVESLDNASGAGKRTDYSFRYSQRFYNDRVNIILGGQVSTGDVPDNYNNMFINDASIEYRLDNEGNRYAKMFYNRTYESLLEGDISKYGVGVVFRRKMRRLIDLFIFFPKKTKTVTTDETDEKE